MSSPQSPNLMSLPIDIRLNILEYILPLNKDGSRSITFFIRQYRLYNQDGAPNTGKHFWTTSPSELSVNRYLRGIGLVNNQLHAESMRILYTRSFILDFHETNIMYQEEGLPRQIPPRHWRWGKSHPGNRDDFFPGLDFGRVRELRIMARPSGDIDFWSCLLNSVQSLFKALRPRIAVQGLKRLTIAVGEVEVVEERKPKWWQDPVEPEITQPGDVMGLLQMAWRHLYDVGECAMVMPGGLMQDDDQAEQVRAMLREICSPWTESDWVVYEEEEIPLPREPNWGWRYSDVPIPPSEWTTQDIENDNFWKRSHDAIPWTELTLQDHMHDRFYPYWELAESMENVWGVLTPKTRCGRFYYVWDQDEELWYEDEEMWDRTRWETDDDFYRKRDVFGEFGPREKEWYIGGFTEIDEVGSQE